MNWSNCPFYNKCKDDKKDIMTYCDVACSYKPKYQVIYADPPWDISYVKELKNGYNVFDLPYPTMKDDDIISLPVKDIADDDAILFLWLIDSRIPILCKLMEVWGFEYKTVGFVWHKASMDGTSQNPTLGKYTRKSCEFCFIGTRGRCLANHHTQNQLQQYLPLAKTVHSQKPKVIRDMIVKMCGDLPRIELFSRDKVEGWDCWGNEVDSDIEL